MSTALVTGAGQGIGKAIAARLAKDGYQVVVVDLDGDLAEKSAADVGGTAVRADVSDERSVARLAEQVPVLDVLVNNAGVLRAAPLAKVSVADYRLVMDVNVLGPLLMTQAFVPALVASGGAVVNVASMSAAAQVPGTGVYPASKAAVASLTQGWALELGPQGVRVNAVAPGRISTEMTASRQTDPAREERTAKLIPSGRIGLPEDVADVVAFLASQDARYVNGQVVYVDGGLVLGTVRYFQVAQG
ncbi:MAG: SDR family NAD(P)-dependent oxidoreductase [Mycobacteriales bacterium]